MSLESWTPPQLFFSCQSSAGKAFLPFRVLFVVYVNQDAASCPCFSLRFFFLFENIFLKTLKLGTLSLPHCRVVKRCPHEPSDHYCSRQSLLSPPFVRPPTRVIDGSPKILLPLFHFFCRIFPLVLSVRCPGGPSAFLPSHPVYSLHIHTNKLLFLFQLLLPQCRDTRPSAPEYCTPHFSISLAFLCLRFPSVCQRQSSWCTAGYAPFIP